MTRKTKRCEAQQQCLALGLPIDDAKGTCIYLDPVAMECVYREVARSGRRLPPLKKTKAVRIRRRGGGGGRRAAPLRPGMGGIYHADNMPRDVHHQPPMPSAETQPPNPEVDLPFVEGNEDNDGDQLQELLAAVEASIEKSVIPRDPLPGQLAHLEAEIVNDIPELLERQTEQTTVPPGWHTDRAGLVEQVFGPTAKGDVLLGGLTQDATALLPTDVTLPVPDRESDP